MKCNITASKQSSGFYDDNHLLEKQLGEITTIAQNKTPALNLKKGKKGSEQNDVLSEGRSKRKSTKLSNEGVEKKKIKLQ